MPEHFATKAVVRACAMPRRHRWCRHKHRRLSTDDARGINRHAGVQFSTRDGPATAAITRVAPWLPLLATWHGRQKKRGAERGGCPHARECIAIYASCPTPQACRGGQCTKEEHGGEAVLGRVRDGEQKVPAASRRACSSSVISATQRIATFSLWPRFKPHEALEVGGNAEVEQGERGKMPGQAKSGPLEDCFAPPESVLQYLGGLAQPISILREVHSLKG
ncbi:hypothetical protein CYMTET_34402 [Cymbomonas tetramitiformis]|uniref:Uncharacterized protein n=1 Tax=Cymbomonas tetramitiformis TaxID=36881 RepID=A0AAE0FB88_9CHLO|nr:hypothetical protein CYMTET_34402 [Cymbomonas tetramitiformis]